jgi:adenosylcobinamide-GDP ribazoletransferase
VTFIVNELRYFFAALRFFTRLPVPRWVGHSQDQLDRAARYFPLIGVLVGAIGAGATEAAAQVLPISLAILLGMAATLLVTGAFHEDGFADMADGFGGGWDRPQILAIMKDSRIGSYGAIGIGMMLLAKYTALTEIDAAADPPVLDFTLLAGHAVSRLASTTLIHTLDYARADDETGKSKPLARRISRGELLVAAVFGLAPCVLLPDEQIAIALGLVALVTLVAGVYFKRRLGGYTGDCLGAVQQLAELAFYLGLLCEFD